MIILASKSEIRQKLLRNAGIAFDVHVSHIDETKEEISTQHPKDIAPNLATQKALAVSKQFVTATVIGCDQTMACEDKIVTKPTSKNNAIKQLQHLRGKSHQLYSAIAIAKNGNIEWQNISTATMTMRNFSDKFLNDYLQQVPDEVIHAVGCYQYENQGIQLFETIDGDYHTILGLPLLPLLSYMRSEGLLAS